MYELNKIKFLATKLQQYWNKCLFCGLNTKVETLTSS